MLQNFNNKTLNYNLSNYNWKNWVLSVIAELKPTITDLETIHLHLSAAEIVKIQKHVQAAFLRKEFMMMFDEFIADHISPLLAGKKYLIQRQGTLRIVIPNQEQAARRLQFHQGIFVGNGRGCRTIWTPLTECKDSNTMWIAGLDESRAITKQFLNEQWSLERFEEECLRVSSPVTLVPGQCHLFCQEHLHGNINNAEGYTRASMDFRVLVEGEEYDRKLPGGYFRLPGDYETDSLDSFENKKFITYAGWESNFTKSIPLPMQRNCIDQYCTQRNISYNDYQFENQFAHWQPSLEHFIKQKPDGIVLVSLYALSDDAERRNYLLNLALDNSVELHFANEYCKLKTADDLKRIQTYMNFAVARTDQHSWEE